ncbi:ATP12 family chaperone protein [Hansschlegelia sp. KR7-227]|uniref:ATP12 family chaperone protein n=1 Tax=Hansschlegelia sp. KR7-227 TaxID=3400914 RepID=UPI003BFEBDD4
MTDSPRPGAASLPKRFYATVDIVERDGLFGTTLDGRPVRTPAKALLGVPTLPLAEAVAQEWRAQGDRIDPATMPLTRLANAAIDGVSRQRDAVADEILKYAGSDLVLYRAEGPARLVARQSVHWDPVLAFARDELCARFVLAEGVMFVEQSADALEAVGRAIPRDDAFVLAGLSTMTTLTGSALIALKVLRRRWTVEEAWRAAQVDDDWNAELWGADFEAEARTAARWREMAAAAAMAIEAAEPR